MDIPFFYSPELQPGAPQAIMPEDTSKHMIQVLRMQIGEAVKLTNGKGDLFTGIITDDHRKRCVVGHLQHQAVPPNPAPKAIAISLLKNASRFEWFIEKAMELGINAIYPLLCDRTEKSAFKHDRIQGILISAMLQSQQAWLPVLKEPVLFKKFLQTEALAGYPQLFIAHCEDQPKQPLTSINTALTSLICIGPEGDFSTAEIDAALSQHFTPISLGNTRLRTETAGMVAAVWLMQA